MHRIVWWIQDLIDWALDRMSEDRRWRVAEFLIDHHLLKCCLASAVVWSMYPGESIWELSECDYCRGDAHTYCGKIQPSEVGP